CQYGTTPPLTEVFPYSANRDPAYEFARDHPTLTWQKHWWRMSDDLYGLFVRTLCDAWNCSLESLLAPLERRDWSDCIHVDESLGPVPGYRFRRPMGTYHALQHGPGRGHPFSPTRALCEDRMKAARTSGRHGRAHVGEHRPWHSSATRTPSTRPRPSRTTPGSWATASRCTRRSC